MSVDAPMVELSYEDSKAIANSDDPNARMALAERPDVEPELLYYLAQDDSVDVRHAVAINVSAPRQTFDLLVKDDSNEVREGLVTKIADITPQMGDDSKLESSAYEILSILAKDKIVRVRETMASKFKSMVGIPVDVVKTLAQDPEASVSAPVLEHSPILTDDILIEIIEEGTASDNLCAISRRVRVSESVSGAVVNTNDTSAIGALLDNQSAQIREEVLDDLIDRAAEVPAWHEALIKRPKLPASGPQKLAGFVGDHLFEALKARDDMDEATLAEVELLVRDRQAEETASPSGHGLFDFLEGPISMALVDRLHSSGGLHGSVISSALQAGDHKFVLAALISLTGLDEAVIKRVFYERNPKGIVSLVWKSKLPPSLILPLQQRMARIPPDDVLEAPKGDVAGREEEFPLSDKEMEWNIQFFSNLAVRDRRA